MLALLLTLLSEPSATAGLPLTASGLVALALAGLTLAVVAHARRRAPLLVAPAVVTPGRGFATVPRVAGRATDGPRHPHAPRAPGLR